MELKKISIAVIATALLLSAVGGLRADGKKMIDAADMTRGERIAAVTGQVMAGSEIRENLGCSAMRSAAG